MFKLYWPLPNRYTHTQTNTHRHTHTHTDTQTHRHTDTHTHTHTHSLISHGRQRHAPKAHMTLSETRALECWVIAQLPYDRHTDTHTHTHTHTHSHRTATLWLAALLVLSHHYPHAGLCLTGGWGRQCGTGSFSQRGQHSFKKSHHYPWICFIS